MEKNITNEYKQNGYYLFRNFFETEEIDTIRDEAKQIFNMQMLEKKIIFSHDISDEEFEECISKLFKTHFEVYANCGKQAQHLISLHRLSLNKKVESTLKNLGLTFPIISTRPVIYFNKKALAKSDEFYKVPPHQDWRSMQGSLNSIVVWVPLADVTESLGALKVVKGSHKFGLLESTENAWFRQINNISSDDFISIEVNKGDALFFSSFLVHSSGNNVLDKIRWSCHFRYNDLNESTFVHRSYAHPYIYKPIQELITPNFPKQQDINQIF